MSKPFTLISRKDTKFNWSELQQSSFDALKEVLTSDSVLAHPEFDKPFILSYNASKYALSPLLSHEHEGKEKPLSFASRVLNNREFNYSVTKKQSYSEYKSIGVFYMGRDSKLVQIMRQ
jgi:hypothetical protein